MSEYIDNNKLLQHLISYQERKKKDPNAQIDSYIGEAIMQIARRYASRSNFSGYTYKEDMISDAVENVLRYIDNFDPNKSKNPFAYITQICHFAFLRRIKEEKTQTYVRFKSIQKYFFEDKIDQVENINHSEEGNEITDRDPLYDNMKDFIDEFEKEIVENRRKSKEYNKRLSKKEKESAKYPQIQFKENE